MGVKAAINAVNKSGFKALPGNNWGSGSLVEVSAESGDDAADYYGEFRGNEPWINPKLEKIAEKNGCYWEWVNPGVIALYKN